jgi:hypothetical protein
MTIKEMNERATKFASLIDVNANGVQVEFNGKTLVFQAIKGRGDEVKVFEAEADNMSITMQNIKVTTY